MDILKVRQFILADSFEFHPTGTFTARNIYEYFSSPSYPAEVNLQFLVGVCFWQPNHSYTVEIQALHSNMTIGYWRTGPLSVDKSDEIMNLRFVADRFPIPGPGFLRFDIYVNGQCIDSQFIAARLSKEEVSSK